MLSVTDSGKGMSQDFQRNRLFQDFSQEDSLSNGLGLGLHMVSRIVNAMGGTVAIVSDQKGSGTRISVTVPLENHSDPKTSVEARSAPLFKSLSGAIKVGIVTIEQSVPLTRNDRLTATSWSMAIASIEKNLESLGLRSERCSLREGNSYDLKVVLDIDLDGCLRALRDDENPVGYSDFAPMLVICHNSTSAQMLRRSWAEDMLSTKVAVDFITLPCGVKQIARAVTHTRTMFDDLNGTTSDLQCDDEPTASDLKTNKITLHDSKVRNKSPEQSPSEHQSAVEIPDLNSKRLDSPLPQTLTHLPKRRASTSHDGPDKSSPTKPPAANSPIPPTSPTPDGPVLLLVDDNRINLQLFVAFAKKNRYRYFAALDGKIALDAFEAVHRNSLEHPTSGEAAANIPTIILMDINMPVMDGYEAAQRIRAYESKHQIDPAKIVAVTALQSGAAQTEAFGSGFDMFLSKPVKLKSLAKLIQEDQDG